jgi:biopolymer transport protein ExbD
MSTELIDDVDDFEPRPRPKRVDDEMDLTPMVDVTFLLLIFFIMTAAFALQKTLKVPPVKDDEEVSAVQVDDVEKDSIVVRIDGDNVFWIGAPLWTEEQKAQSSLDMRAKVREAKQGEPGSPGPSKMMVQAHEDAVYEKLVDAIDAGSAAQVNEVSVAVLDDEDF